MQHRYRNAWSLRASALNFSYKATYVLLLILFAADAYSTWAGISRGLSREANPLVAWLFQILGLELGIQISFVVRVIAVSLLYDNQWLTRRGKILILLPCIAAYLYVVANNFSILVK